MKQKQSVSSRVVLTAMLVVAALAPAAGVLAQDTQEPAATPAPTLVPEPTPIPAAEILGRAAAIGKILRDATSRTEFDDELTLIGEDFENEKEHISELEEETGRRLAIEGPASVIEEIEKAWVRSGARLDEWLKTLSSGVASIDKEQAKLDEEAALWELTRSAEGETELPPAVLQRIDETLDAIATSKKGMHTTRDAMLTLQSKIGKEKAHVDEIVATQREEIANRRRGIMGIDSPPIWKMLSVPGVDGGPSEQLTAVWSKNFASVRDYVVEQQASVRRHVVLLVMTIAGLIFLRRKAALWAQQDKSLKTTVRVLDRPVAAAFVITLVLGGLIHPHAPSAWKDFLGLILLFALLRILPQMLPRTLLPGAYLIALLYFLDRVVKLAPDGNLVNRLALLLLSVVGAGVCVWFLRTIDRLGSAVPERWRRAIIFFTRLAFVAFVIGVLANIIGSVAFATLITLGMLGSVFLAVLFWVAAVLLRAVVRVVLLTRIARKFGVVRLHADTVRRVLFRVITASAVVAWVVFSLQDFDILDATIAQVLKVFEFEISIGDFSIVVDDILIFFLVIWLSLKISQLLRFVLDTDVLPRMDLPRGVPGAITRLTHYVIIVAGVVIAATAAGLDFSKLTLIVGALGVGIGFGLQNVVNNFVSGLILLFERPVRVGDKVQVGQLSGTVKNIGMRASIVGTWEGAEVIVPNANLISSEVVNWTLSDDRRRMEIPAGVAYGTDPTRVIELFIGLARDHPDVLDDPEPKAIFTGFGASSLDFELRAWTTGDFVAVASDLRVGINRALADAGIEIPFPQQDLHLRTVDDEAGVALAHSERERDLTDSGEQPAISGSDGAEDDEET
ncbi:MAG: mechanosensitive ion channel [Acidobacteria bacterium]|nr:mechanosensitive ion channel [Candidatus Sulfomarinibacter sp. MAG AM1]